MPSLGFQEPFKKSSGRLRTSSDLFCPSPKESENRWQITTPQKSDMSIAKMRPFLKGPVAFSKAHHFGVLPAVSFPQCIIPKPEFFGYLEGALWDVSLPPAMNRSLLQLHSPETIGMSQVDS